MSCVSVYELCECELYVYTRTRACVRVWHSFHRRSCQCVGLWTGLPGNIHDQSPDSLFDVFDLFYRI